MSKPLAQFVSVVMHPSLMGTYLSALVLFNGPAELLQYTDSLRLMLLGLVFITTFLMPAMALVFLHQIGIIKDLTLPERKDRFLPFLISLVSYGGAAFYFFTKLPQVILLPAMMVAICIAVFIVLLTTFFYKISAHATGISGVAGALISLQQTFPDSDFLYPLMAAVLVWGVILSARLALKAHTPGELLVGSVVGFGTCYAGLLLLA
ncbi:hypothetical protein [Rhodoflexus caldus]|uniref:hypothetical protein n=1 Tax=Rhodoflexus caldus TaxID=2891236 RepID=UPI00202A9DD6|nr:hypothetical protein [Rhodoflexus caldus]